MTLIFDGINSFNQERSTFSYFWALPTPNLLLASPDLSNQTQPIQVSLEISSFAKAPFGTPRVIFSKNIIIIQMSKNVAGKDYLNLPRQEKVTELFSAHA